MKGLLAHVDRSKWPADAIAWPDEREVYRILRTTGHRMTGEDRMVGILANVLLSGEAVVENLATFIATIVGTTVAALEATNQKTTDETATQIAHAALDDILDTMIPALGLPALSEQEIEEVYLRTFQVLGLGGGPPDEATIAGLTCHRFH